MGAVGVDIPSELNSFYGPIVLKTKSLNVIPFKKKPFKLGDRSVESILLKRMPTNSSVCGNSFLYTVVCCCL